MPARTPEERTLVQLWRPFSRLYMRYFPENTPEWFQRLLFKKAYEYIVKRVQAREGKRGRVGAGWRDTEGLAVLWYANSTLKVSQQKLAEFLRRLAEEWGEEKYTISDRVIRGLLKIAEERAGEIREVLAKYEEEAKGEKCFVLVDMDLLKQWVKWYKAMERGKLSVDEMLKLTEELAGKITTYSITKADGSVYYPIIELMKKVVYGKLSLHLFLNYIRSYLKRMAYHLGKKYGVCQWDGKSPKVIANPLVWQGAEDYYYLRRVVGISRVRPFRTLLKLLRPDLEPTLERITSEDKRKEKGIRASEQHVILPEEWKEVEKAVREFCEERGWSEKKCRLYWLALRFHIETQAREGWDSKRSGFRNVRVKMFNQQKCTVSVIEEKTDAVWEGIRVGKYFPTLCEELKEWIEENGLGPEDYLLSYGKRRITSSDYNALIKYIGKRLGKELTAHDMRRTGAYWALIYLNLPMEALVMEKGAGGSRFYSPFGVAWEDPKTLLDYYVNLAKKRELLWEGFAQYARRLLEDPERVRRETFEAFGRIAGGF